ncbi:MAG: histidine phosphatase family protein [bacterium]|nr:histidine phosphatase family protein [bacterium]
MLTITYFVHGTTTDNENGISTGWNPGELSTLGITQSKELKRLIAGKKFDVVFSSDLKRAVDSARFMFGDTFQTDERLRECNYGDLNGAREATVEPLYLKHIDTPFPNGESMKNVEKRMHNFCEELLKKYNNQNIAIVAHKAPQLALEVIVSGKTWVEAIRDDWRHKTPKAWQPGWEYVIMHL